MVRLWGQIIISLFFDKLTAKVIRRILGENIKFIFTSRVMGEIFLSEFFFLSKNFYFFHVAVSLAHQRELEAKALRQQFFSRKLSCICIY